MIFHQVQFFFGSDDIFFSENDILDGLKITDVQLGGCLACGVDRVAVRYDRSCPANFEKLVLKAQIKKSHLTSIH